MKKLMLILQILEESAQEMHEESKKCWEKDMRYASAYADGKEKAYRHAAKVIEAYINNELPWGEE